MSVSVAVKTSCKTIGEGPHWEESSSSLLYVDIGAQDIHRYSTLTGQDSTLHLDRTASLIVPRHSGGYVIGLGKSLSVVDWETQAVTSLAEVDLGVNSRFNDGKCDVSGRLWAGTMGQDITPGQPERQIGSLYTLEKNKSVRTHLSKLDISNGLAWTADQQTMFFIDSIPRKVYAFDFDLDAGTISNQRDAIDFSTHSMEDWGLPDGMTIDTNGHIWVACYGAGKVLKFDVETSQLLETVTFPAKMITSCAFGGAHYDELYVTSSRYGVSDEELTSFPLAGSVFKVTDLGAKGTAPSVYQG